MKQGNGKTKRRIWCKRKKRKRGVRKKTSDVKRRQRRGNSKGDKESEKFTCVIREMRERKR